VKWKSREKTERVPFVIYADFESCLVLVHDDSGVLDEHVPSVLRVHRFGRPGIRNGTDDLFRSRLHEGILRSSRK
jgi:hypothetical protein